MATFPYRIFVTVVEQESFARAAEQLYLTPPAVSHAVAKMEKEFGMTLFDRTHTGAKLTRDGRALLPYIRNILNAEERLNQEISMTKGVNAGTITIGTFNSVCVSWIPGIVSSFRVDHPGVDINIFQGGYSDVVEWLQGGACDLCFVTTTTKDEFEMVPLIQDRMMCVVPVDFQTRHEDYITPDELMEQTFIYQREGYDADTRTYLSDNGITGKSKHAIESDHSILAMVESGLGIGLLPELIVRNIAHGATTYPMEPAAYRIICIAWLKNRPLSIAAEKMKQHIMDYVHAVEEESLL